MEVRTGSPPRGYKSYVGGSIEVLPFQSRVKLLVPLVKDVLDVAALHRGVLVELGGWGLFQKTDGLLDAALIGPMG